MTLSEDVRNELAQIAPARRCDALAEISALFHTAGSLHLRGHGELAFHLDVSASSVARRAFSLLRGLDVESEIRTYRQRAFDRPMRYQLHVLGGPATVEVLREAGIVGRGGRPLTRPPARVVGRPCCRSAYVRGALLGAGTVSGPRAAQLEVRFSDLEGAEFLVKVAAQDDVFLRARERRAYAVALTRNAETVADTLALAGASDAALAIDEHAVVAAARSRRTGSPTPTTRISSAPRVPRTASSVPSSCSRSGASWHLCPASSRRWRRCGGSIPPCRFASWRRSASPGPARQPCSADWRGLWNWQGDRLRTWPRHA